MARLSIIYAPDPRLKIKCRPVAKVDRAVRDFMADMLETMYAAPGIGLSAPQVGDGRRILVCDVAREDEAPQPIQMVNPEIAWASDDPQVFLSTHMDTVPPFIPPTEDEEKIMGRGSCDAKGIIASQIIAAG